jgi:hypothetical protein
MRAHVYLKIFFSLLCTAGCSPGSIEDFHWEGESQCRALVDELQAIHDRDELLRAVPKIKKSFEDLVALMIRAREFQEEHPDESLPLISENSFSNKLQQELRRIYTLEGGREIMEGAQQEALVRLDAFERACAKKRQAL